MEVEILHTIRMLERREDLSGLRQTEVHVFEPTSGRYDVSARVKRATTVDPVPEFQ